MGSVCIEYQCGRSRILYDQLLAESDIGPTPSNLENSNSEEIGD